MKPGKQIKGSFAIASLTFALALCDFVLTAEAVAQTAKRTNQSRANLAQIQWPDITRLEPEVRDQLATVKNALEVAIRDQTMSDPALAERLGQAGETYHAYSLNVPAAACYGNAHLLAPKDFRWPHLLAKIDQQEGRADDALRHFQEAAVLNPDYIAIEVNLGNLYLELGRDADAEIHFQKALGREPKNGAAMYGLGQLALSQRRYADAVNRFEKALEQVPAANRIHYSLALAYRGLGDLAKAESHLALRGAVGVRVADPLFDRLSDLMAGERGHLIRGQTAMNAKRFADAAVEFRKAIAARPDSVAAHLSLATTLVQLNDPAAAVKEFATVLRLDPQNPNAHFNLAIVLSSQEKHSEAVEKLQALLKTTPGDSAARFFLAKELLKLERRDEALAEFLRVSETDTGNEEAALQAVNLLMQAGRHANALKLLEKTHARYPQKIDTAAVLAYLLAASTQYDLRDGARALKLAQEVYQVTGLPQHGAIVPLALAELGRCADAAEWQRKMIALAEQKQRMELAAKLKSALNLYEGKQTCRPAGQ